MQYNIANIFLTVYALIITLIPISAQHVQFTANQTVTWNECIASYENLALHSSFASLIKCGTTDVGKPLHLFVINKDGIFYPELFDRKKTIVMINNGIHPGEPDGIDASLMLARELLDSSSNLSSILDSVIICIVPIYNVDGALNRGSKSRANQNGPEQYGFRGNARNLDLNRDFIKCDSRNAQSFNQCFTRIRPNILVDTHVSNGADYPYTMTLITTQTDKLGGVVGKYLREKMEPALFTAMKNCGQEMCPYVNTMGRTPESGLSDFLETSRFATGYAALYNTIGFTTESHMLKPYPQRVEATYSFLVFLLQYARDKRRELQQLKLKADDEMLKLKSFGMSFQLDTTAREKLAFDGYEARTEPALVGKGERTRYDHKATWNKEIPLYRKYRSKIEVSVPKYYFIAQSWHEAIERLQWNGVMMNRFERDTIIEVEAYSILDYHSPSKPYEGHFLHSEVKVELTKKRIPFYAGDYFIPTNQVAVKYICEVLEPQSEDSFFAWNFFDSVLQQKEWFSDYVFEEIAEELLQSDSKLKTDFETAMKNDATLEASHWNQLYWIYKHSEYFEQSVNVYPVYRFNQKL